MKMIVFNSDAFLAAWGKIYSPEKELQPTLAYQAHIVHTYLAEQHAKFDKLRQSIINKYADKDEKGEVSVVNNQVHFADEVLDSVNKEFAELMSLELQPAVPLKLKLEELQKNNISLTGPDFSLLQDLLDFN